MAMGKWRSFFGWAYEKGLFLIKISEESVFVCTTVHWQCWRENTDLVHFGLDFLHILHTCNLFNTSSYLFHVTKFSEKKLFSFLLQLLLCLRLWHDMIYNFTENWISHLNQILRLKEKNFGFLDDCWWFDHDQWRCKY